MKDFYQKHLDQVSRSFAYCISRLETPLRQWVSSSYLICRILDTLEDAPWKDSQSQLKGFQSFERYLEKTPSEEEVLTWSQQIPHSIPKGEKILLQDARDVFQKFHEFPDKVKAPIRDMVKSMSEGMQFFVKNKNESIKLNSLNEVNRYCFFVAGVVGEILTQLVNIVGPNQRDWVKSNLLRGYHFGLFLQKVNLLKDQREDEKEGRYFIPSRSEVFASLEVDAYEAFQYLSSIPKELKNFRLFCAWSLYLGLASLPYIEKSYRDHKNLKIPRLKTMTLFQKIEKIILEDQALDQLFLELSAEVKFDYKNLHQSAKISKTTIIPSMYHGLLPENEILQLGV